MNAAKANERKVVTSCPHCLTAAIGTEYKALGGDFTVFHTQMISDLIGQATHDGFG